jgi:hypothetical protein
LVDRPKPTDDPEERTLATAIGAGDQQVHALNNYQINLKTRRIEKTGQFHFLSPV